MALAAESHPRQRLIQELEFPVSPTSAIIPDK